MGWLSALDDPRSEVRILHGNRSRASGFFIYFKKSAVRTFRVVLTTRTEHLSGALPPQTLEYLTGKMRSAIKSECSTL